MDRKSLLFCMFEFLDTLKSGRSSCDRAQVAAMLTDNTMHRIFSYGYNGNVAGGANACDSDEVGNCGCIHAEINVLIKPRPIVTGPLVMLSTDSPCRNCAKAIINAGVTSLYFVKWYRECEPLWLLLDAEIEIIRYKPKIDEVAKVTIRVVEKRKVSQDAYARRPDKKVCPKV